MRRLLASFAGLVVCVVLLLGIAAGASAGGFERVPSPVAKISIAISSPLKSVTGYHKPVHRTLTSASALASAVKATDALPVAKLRGVCPMIIRLGPELTVTFRNSRGTALAVAEVAVTFGSKGQSATSPCFPIRFTSGNRTTVLLGNGWVRLMGKLAGTAIS